VSSLALSDEKQHTKPLKDRLDTPFSIHTKRLLELVPTLKKAIYWDQKVVDGLTLIKKNSVPFADETSDHEGEVDEEGDGPEPFLELTSPSPLRQGETSKKKIKKTTTTRTRARSVETIVQSNNWLKQYESILTEDLLEESGSPQINSFENKSTSPTTRLPDICPPLSSIPRQPIESFSAPHSQSKLNQASLSVSDLKPLKRNRMDPLHASSQKRIITSSASQPLLLNKDKDKRLRKSNLSLTKL
jgi:hypothetical protein